MSATLPPRAFPALDAPPDPSAGTALPEVAALPGPLGTAWVDRLAQHECPAITARRARRKEASGVDQDPIVWARALGSNVWDPDGNRFVDLTGGFGVCSAGHGHPAVVDAACAQARQLVHGLGDAFPSTVRIALAEQLAELLPGELSMAIFGLSGSEAVEAAVKTAAVATGRRAVVAFEAGYHGLSLGALPQSHYRPAFREPFEGILSPHVRYAPYGGDPGDLSDVAAVLVEPLQGRGGVRVPPRGWLATLRARCDDAGAALIFDEIFTGFGRAGEWVLAGTDAADGVVPDLICLGKGLTSGFPLSACVGTEAVMRGWGSSRGEALHTSTYLGHPVGCAAALAVIELLRGGLLDRARELGDRMDAALTELVRRRPDRYVGHRGRGAMRGLVLADGVEPMAICREALIRGFFVLPAGLRGEVLSLTPPLTLTGAQLQAAIDALA